MKFFYFYFFCYLITIQCYADELKGIVKSHMDKPIEGLSFKIGYNGFEPVDVVSRKNGEFTFTIPVARKPTIRIFSIESKRYEILTKMFEIKNGKIEIILRDANYIALSDENSEIKKLKDDLEREKAHSKKIVDDLESKVRDFKQKLTKQEEEALAAANEYLQEISNISRELANSKDSLSKRDIQLSVVTQALDKIKKSYQEIYEKFNQGTTDWTIAKRINYISSLEVFDCHCENFATKNEIQLRFVVSAKNRKKITSSSESFEIRIKSQSADNTLNDINTIEGQSEAKLKIDFPADTIKYSFKAQKKDFLNDNFFNGGRNYFINFFHAEYDKVLSTFTIWNLNDQCGVGKKTLEEISTKSRNIPKKDFNDKTLRDKNVTFYCWDWDKEADGDEISIFLNGVKIIDNAPLKSENYKLSTKVIMVEGENEIRIVSEKTGKNPSNTAYIFIDDGYYHIPVNYKCEGEWTDKKWKVFVNSEN